MKLSKMAHMVGPKWSPSWMAIRNGNNHTPEKSIPLTTIIIILVMMVMMMLTTTTTTMMIELYGRAYILSRHIKFALPKSRAQTATANWSSEQMDLAPSATGLVPTPRKRAGDRIRQPFLT